MCDFIEAIVRGCATKTAAPTPSGANFAEGLEEGIKNGTNSLLKMQLAVKQTKV
jgi:hypothetical protein